MSIDNNILVSCRQLTKSYHKGDTLVTPLENLDLDLQRGHFLALMGPSGSGKTTLLNLIAGIDTPTAGEIIIDGLDISRMSRGQLTKWRAKNVGYIFQLYHLIPVLTAYENIELPLLNRPMTKAERRQRVANVLELVNLSDRADHFPRQLSGGQEQRVAIARALVVDPPLLVADEPTGDLDAKAATQILELLQTLGQQLHKTIVMVTHDAKAAAYADQVLHLEKGQLVEAHGEALGTRH
jgi:putative ABC transport system ATP-binding protein